MSVPSDTLMKRVSLAIESRSGLTKTAVTRLVKGTKQDVLRAVDALIVGEYVESGPGERAAVLTSLRPYRDESVSPNDQTCTGAQTTGTIPESGGEPLAEPVCITNGKNRSGQRQTDNGGRTNNGDMPRVSLGLVREPRCRCCRDPELLDQINRMLAEGYSLGAILEASAAANAELPSKSRITIDSLQTHRMKHFPIHASANAAWRTIVEQHAEAAAAVYEQGVANLVTSRALLELVRARGFAVALDPSTQITVDQAMSAAEKLEKLAANEDMQLKWAKAQADMNRITEAMRALPAPYQQQVLDILDGRPQRVPLALVEVSGEDELDEPFVGRNDEDDD